jgi:hypothetical protein
MASLRATRVGSLLSAGGGAGIGFLTAVENRVLPGSLYALSPYPRRPFPPTVSSNPRAGKSSGGGLCVDMGPVPGLMFARDIAALRLEISTSFGK